ncbi:hypothetical protein ACBJ59_10425 [Nonomuraea sp. MTCD27]|uniref:hypothetical protein n=1 Tax=Nonomuraea sp. MTCD27 TaxID=1676747 RepID=UPI0035BECA03
MTITDQTAAERAATVTEQAAVLLDRSVSYAAHTPSQAMPYAVAGVGKALLAVAAELAALRAEHREESR